MIVVGVIVAAGESTRMGRLKQLIPVGDRPMLQWVIDAAEASRLHQVAVVTGPADTVRSGVRLGRSVPAVNPHPELGTMSSLRAGLAALEPCDAVVKLVADQPEVTTGDINALIEAWDPELYRAALVRYRDGDGHPLLIRAEALAEITDQEGDRLLWRLMESGPTHRLVLDRQAPLDVNTPDDLATLAVRLGHSFPAPPTA